MNATKITNFLNNLKESDLRKKGIKNITTIAEYVPSNRKVAMPPQFIVKYEDNTEQKFTVEDFQDFIMQF